MKKNHYSRLSMMLQAVLAFSTFGLSQTIFGVEAIDSISVRNTIAVRNTNAPEIWNRYEEYYKNFKKITQYVPDNGITCASKVTPSTFANMLNTKDLGPFVGEDELKEIKTLFNQLSDDRNVYFFCRFHTNNEYSRFDQNSPNQSYSTIPCFEGDVSHQFYTDQDIKNWERSTAINNTGELLWNLCFNQQLESMDDINVSEYYDMYTNTGSWGINTNTRQPVSNNLPQVLRNHALRHPDTVSGFKKIMREYSNKAETDDWVAEAIQQDHIFQSREDILPALNQFNNYYMNHRTPNLVGQLVERLNRIKTKVQAEPNRPDKVKKLDELITPLQSYLDIQNHNLPRDKRNIQQMARQFYASENGLKIAHDIEPALSSLWTQTVKVAGRRIDLKSFASLCDTYDRHP